ncbi:hypothetical protein Bbelb_231530 [Branchiostoma belcheri]|nr:hypothetical protein Bbelb_231530 [Branchiostoma belcheri]
MPQAQTKLSTVADELRELDLIFKRGSDLDAAERGYAGKLIHAISCENKLLKCEALKSLGDLYLHKAKTSDCRIENFNRACALYQELLRHCRGKEEKQVIQHRIKYAEKCTKLAHSPRRFKLGDGDSDNIILAVSRMLDVVKNEKTKVKGRLLTPVIEAYIQLFVTAVVDRHVRLKMEILKSLGDLYLERARVGKEEAAFTKAVGLYRAALDRCEDADARETLKHRIEYAKKVREKVQKKQPKETRLTEYRKPGDESLLKSAPTFGQVGRDVISQGNDGGTYRDRLREGCKALQIGDLDRAELNFAAALKTVRVKASNADEHWKEAEPMIKLSDVYLKRGMHSKDGGDFTKAAALCNAALVRAKAEDKEGIKQTILEITRSFIRHVLSIEQTVDSGNTEKNKLILKEHRDHVGREIKRIEHQVDPYSLDDADPKIREVEKMRADEIKTLFQTIIEQRRTFIASLVDECMEVMGPPPCKYAMMGLGSQATGLATPYSDLEFAILVERETQIDVKYFRNLTHYLHLKVINLGETILPAMGIKSLNDFSSDDPLDNWFYDSVTTRGFAFDGAMPHACKTPLGRGQTCSLIRTPGSMIKVLLDDVTLHLKKGYHLASILGNVSLIAGDQDLVDEYSAVWEQQLKKDEGKIPLSIAKTTLSENMESFRRQDLTSAIPVVKVETFSTTDLKESVRTPTARLSDVKKEMYRFSSLAVSCWALICNIQPTTIWDTIQRMFKHGIIGGENAHHLMVLVSISAELRLRTYMNNRGQVENMSALSSISTDADDVGEKLLKKVFYMSNTKQLLRYYYTARPLKYFISTLADIQAKEEPSILFDNSPRLQAEIYGTLCDYRESKRCTERALQEYREEHGENTSHPSIAAVLHNLGSVCSHLADYRNAISYHEQSLQMLQSVYGKNTVHPDIAVSLVGLGGAWNSLGDYRKAVSCFEQSLDMMRSIYRDGATHHLIASSFHGLGIAWRNIGDYRKATDYYQQSLEMERRIHGTPVPIIAALLTSLGGALDDRGDYKKAKDYYEQSLQINQNIYGENTAHPDIAMSLNNLGGIWRNLGNYKKAIGFYEQAIQINRSINGETTAHPHISATLYNLGNVYSDIGDYRKAISYYEQSLQMDREIYGENTAHCHIADTLGNLGTAWDDLGYHEKAVSFEEQSQRMLRSLSTNKNLANAKPLTKLGLRLSSLGDHRNAISYLELSLQLERSIHGKNTAHPNIARSLNNLGTVYSKLGDDIKAMSYHEQSLQMKRRIYGDDTPHADIANSLTNLGIASRGLSDPRKALFFFEQSLKMERLIYGELTPHRDIAISLGNLGSVWGDLGDHIKATSCCEQCLKMLQSIFGENTAHVDIARSLTYFGMAIQDLGDTIKAIMYFEQALQMMRSLYGKGNKHPDIALTLRLLAEAWYELGDVRNAVSYYEQLTKLNRVENH